MPQWSERSLATVTTHYVSAFSCRTCFSLSRRAELALVRGVFVGVSPFRINGLSCRIQLVVTGELVPAGGVRQRLQASSPRKALDSRPGVDKLTREHRPKDAVKRPTGQAKACPTNTPTVYLLAGLGSLLLSDLVSVFVSALDSLWLSLLPSLLLSLLESDLSFVPAVDGDLPFLA